MRNRVVIFATLVAILYGSIGAPTTLHACSAAGTVSVGRSCGMCERPASGEKSHTTETPRKDGSSSKGSSSSKKGCCSETSVITHLDPATVGGAVQPVLAVVAIFFPHLLLTDLVGSGITNATFLYPVDHPPAAFAALGRTTWLRTAHLLI